MNKEKLFGLYTNELWYKILPKQIAEPLRLFLLSSKWNEDFTTFKKYYKVRYK